MQIPLKQRLVGAAVLVALSVIFLPMIFDGAGRRVDEPPGPMIPPEPTFERGIEIPSASLSTDRETSSPMQAPLAARNEATVSALPVPDESRSIPGPAEAEPRPAALAWVVQIGSFGEEANAVAERDRLRAAGYSAFVEPYSVDGREYFRVKVGPEPRRQEAEALAARLAEQEKIKGIVVTHP